MVKYLFSVIFIVLLKYLFFILYFIVMDFFKNILLYGKNIYFMLYLFCFNLLW